MHSYKSKDNRSTLMSRVIREALGSKILLSFRVSPMQPSIRCSKESTWLGLVCKMDVMRSREFSTNCSNQLVTLNPELICMVEGG